jgi:serine phosphatase RsbU (regulator of sigma subunit)
VFEACNEAGEAFGAERIREAIAANLGGGVAELDEAIIESLRKFIHPTEPDDDLCLVTIEAASAPALAAVGERSVPVGK